MRNSKNEDHEGAQIPDLRNVCVIAYMTIVVNAIVLGIKPAFFVFLFMLQM